MRHLGCDYKLCVMRPGFFLFLFARSGGAAGREISELRASRLAHLQSKAGLEGRRGGGINAGEEGGEVNHPDSDGSLL